MVSLAFAAARDDDFLHERADADLALAAEVLGVGLAGQLHTKPTTTQAQHDTYPFTPHVPSVAPKIHGRQTNIV